MSRAEYQRNYRTENKEKISLRDSNYYQVNKDKKAVQSKRSKYFLHYPNATEQQYSSYLSTTHCECCGSKFGTTVHDWRTQDHDHATGELRGVICNRCNISEGHLKTPERAYQVACYMASNTPLNELIKGLT